MPGQPVKFTDVTIILVGGSSGSGKTTLCSYLCRGRKKFERLSTDRLMTVRQAEKHKSHINDHVYEKNITYLETTKNPQEHVQSISTRLSSDFLISLIFAEINDILSKNKKLKCLTVEGYILHDVDVCSGLAKKLKNRSYRVWSMESC